MTSLSLKPSQSARKFQIDLSTLENKSEWLTRKERNLNIKNLQLLQNRIQMLQIENDKKNKKIQDTQNKVLHFQRIRNQYTETEKMVREQYKIETEQALQELKRRTDNVKFKMNQHRDEIKNKMIEQKQKDYKEIKSASKKNDTVISQQKLDILHLKKAKRDFVKCEEEATQKRLKQFHEDLKMKYTKFHFMNKLQNAQESLLQQQEMLRLEQQEIMLLQKLQASQEAQDEMNLALNKIYHTKSMNQFIIEKPKKVLTPVNHEENQENQILKTEQ